MDGPIRSLCGAIGFLTRVPVGGAPGPGDVARGAVLFPIVGGAVGAVVGAVALGSYRWAHASPALAGALAVAAGAILTGAMHLDALADSADALGVPERERALEVMSEPAIGSFGAAAIAINLLVESAALGMLVMRPGALGAIIAVWALSRAAPLPVGAALPYARAGEGAGSIITDGVSPVRAAMAIAIALAIAAMALGLRVVVPILVAGGATVVWAIMCRRRFGGTTGDTLGANVQMAETFGVVALALVG